MTTMEFQRSFLRLHFAGKPFRCFVVVVVVFSFFFFKATPGGEGGLLSPLVLQVTPEKSGMITCYLPFFF